MENSKPYKKYRPSNLDWLGDIPEHWTEFKPKTIGFLFGGLTGKKGDDFKIENELNISPYIPFTNIANNFVIDSKKLAYVKTLENEKQNLVKKNDLLFLMSSENFEDIGKTSLMNDDIDGLYLNSFCKGFRIVDDNYHPKFLNYLFAADINRKRLSIQARGFTRINLKIGKVNDLAMFAPHFEEQKTIANFLDYKTAKIDRFIRKKKQLIKLLNEQKTSIINHAVTKGLDVNVKTKPSGIDWLGDIPEHWKVRRTKVLFKLVTNFAPINNDEELLSVYTEIGVKPRKDLVAKGNKSSTTDGYWLVQKGDIIVNKLLAWMGAVGVSNYDGVTSPAYDILRSKGDVNPYFFHYLFRNPKTFKEFKRHSRGIMDMRLRLYFSELGNIYMPLPPLEEQNQIVTYIEKETSVINKTILNIEKEIALVQEYRTALIAEAVTGKIDVRDYKTPILEEEDLVYEEIEEELNMVAEDGEEMELE